MRSFIFGVFAGLGLAMLVHRQQRRVEGEIEDTLFASRKQLALEVYQNCMRPGYIEFLEASFPGAKRAYAGGEAAFIDWFIQARFSGSGGSSQ